MKGLTRTLIILATVLCLSVAGLLLAYDQIYAALPASIALRLPALQGEPPEPLPAPVQSAATIDPAELIIPGIPTNTATPTEAPTATPTTAPAEPTAVVEPTAAPTETPTPEPPTPTPSPTPEPLPALHVMEGLVNIPQTFNNCGPANLSIVLSYHGDGTTQEQAASYLKPNANDRNVSPWQISDYVNEQTGLKSTVHSAGTPEILKRLIVAGLPPVIERGIDYNDGQGWYGHYLTLFGYDDATQQYYAMNTYSRPWAPNGETFSYEEIETTWKDFNYTFYVVYPEARAAEVQAIIGPTLLDEQLMWEEAVARARAQIEADPADKFAWFNLGSSLTELGIIRVDPNYYQQASEAFDQARLLELPYRMLWYQFRPYLAYYNSGRLEDVIMLADATLATSGGQAVEETYYWKGNALALQGDAVGAGENYRQALAVNQNFYYAQWALDYLTRDQ